MNLYVKSTFFFNSSTDAYQPRKVVIFGDPDNRDAVCTIPADKVKIICHDGDNICAGGVLVLAAHMNYQIDAQAGAEFIAEKVK